MDFLQPASWAEALQLRAERPTRCRSPAAPTSWSSSTSTGAGPVPCWTSTRVAELRRVGTDDGAVRLGAGVTYAPVIDELGDGCPAWRWPPAPSARRRSATAARSAATSARLAGRRRAPAAARRRRHGRGGVGARGTRLVPADEFFTGVKRNALAPDELIAAVHVPTADRPAAVLQGRHPQRDGDRGQRVRLRAAPAAGAVGTGIGSAAPTPRRATEAEAFLPASWRPPGCGSPGGAAARRRWPRAFGELVAAAASPIDDVRGTAAYRRHALAVMARRAAPGPGTTTGRRPEACA